jgi:putative endonuclease
MLWRGKAKRKTKGELARIGEDHAARYLTSKGYRLRERNYRAHAGEVDIIAEHDGELVFIEVKARSSDEHGTPVEAVTTWKQRRIVSVANSYLRTHERRERAMRFDVVEVFLTPAGRVQKINVIQGAFDAGR